jgi:hypothetical protein
VYLTKTAKSQSWACRRTKLSVALPSHEIEDVAHIARFLVGLL